MSSPFPGPQGLIGAPAWLMLAPGIGLLLFGILIIVMPELLAVLVGTGFALAGLVLLSIGWRVRQAAQHGARGRFQVEIDQR